MRRKRGPSRTVVAALITLSILAACQVQWISPYSADLQKWATDMLAEVVAWESHMRAAAGTAAADPRNPDVQTMLEKWHGEIEAMSEIELGIDPGSTVCDEFIRTISGSISEGLKKTLPAGPEAARSGIKPIAHCETLPGIFTRMIKQVTMSMPAELSECKLPWLSDGYFTSLQEGRATIGAASPPAAGFARGQSENSERGSASQSNNELPQSI